MAERREMAEGAAGAETIPRPSTESPVAVLYTGGTFGMLPGTDGLAARLDLRADVAALADASVPWTYAQTDRAIDSAEADPGVLAALADRIRDLVDVEQPRGVVVIHGTDTMVHGAAHTAFALADLAVPLVFTGSQRPLGAEGTDAPGNFRDAFAAVARGRVPGIAIAFDGRLLPAVRAVKRSSESLFGFTAHRPAAEGAIGVDDATAAALAAARGREFPRIGLVTASPGLSARQLDAVLEDCPAGVVLECYGAGTAPVLAGGLAAPLRRAAERGTVVVAVTRCEHGSVDLGRYAVGSALAEAGVVGGGDMTAEAAVGKLAALGRAGFTGEALRELIARNLIGERSG